MKWIGQHIWDFISRFRNDVYLESIADASEDTDKFLVAKSDGKVAYRTGAEVLSDIGASSESTDLEFNGAAANGVLTYGGASVIDVESTLTWVATSETLRVGAGDAGDATISRTLWTGGHQGDLYIKGADASAGATDINGGDLFLYGGISTGTGTEGKINFYTSDAAGGSANSQNASATRGYFDGDGLQVSGTLTMGSTAAMTNVGQLSVAAQPNITSVGTLTNLQVDYINANASTLTITDSTDTGDLFSIATTTHGATTIATVDDDATAANLTMDVHGDIILDSHTGTAASGGIKIKAAGTEIMNINAHHGGTFLQMYENGGASTNSSFNIDVAAHGDTTLSTVDGGGASADFKVLADGDITLDAAGDITLNVDSDNNTTNNTVVFQDNGTVGFSYNVGRAAMDMESNASSDYPYIQMNSTSDDANASALTFKKSRTDSSIQIGEAGDSLGKIEWKGYNDGTPALKTFAQVISTIADPVTGAEAGDLTIKVASYDGVLTDGLKLHGDTNADGEVDVTIGAGAASVTTIAGTLAMGSTTAERVSSGQHIHKQVKVVLSQGDCNDLHSTPIQLVPKQGANTVIVPVSGIIMVDNNTAVNQTNSAADLNFHYADQEPGVYTSTSLFHIRRFMVGNNTTDIVYSIGEITGFEISQNLTDCVNKEVEVSVDSALTNDSMTSIKIFLSYHVIDIS